MNLLTPKWRRIATSKWIDPLPPSSLPSVNSRYNKLWIVSLLCPDPRSSRYINTIFTSKQGGIKTTKWLESPRIGWYPVLDPSCHDHDLSLYISRIKSWHSHTEESGYCGKLYCCCQFLALQLISLSRWRAWIYPPYGCNLQCSKTLTRLY